MASWAELAVPVAPAYGTAQNPLLSRPEGCPVCEGELVGEAHSLAESMLAGWALTESERAHFAAIHHVECTECGWQGSAYR